MLHRSRVGPTRIPEEAQNTKRGHVKWVLRVALAAGLLLCVLVLFRVVDADQVSAVAALIGSAAAVWALVRRPQNGNDPDS